MPTDYAIIKIKELIAQYEREIAKLAIALEVLDQVHEPEVKPKQKTKPVRKYTQMRSEELRGLVLKVLEGGNKLTSGAILAEIHHNLGMFENRVTRKAYWNVLYNMKAKGLVLRHKDGTYSKAMTGDLLEKVNAENGEAA